MPAAVGQAQQISGRRRDHRHRPGVQGVNTKFDACVLHDGRRLSIELGDAVTDATWERTIEGGSTVTVTAYDPLGKIRNSVLLAAKLDLSVDGLWFRLVKISKTGTSLTLTFEEREVVLLKNPDVEPKKALRSQMTRAEFIYSMVREVRPKLDFYCPELHEEQPIASSRARPQPRESSDADAVGVGFEPGANLTIPDHAGHEAKATAENKRIGAIGLAICDELAAPYEARWALICAMMNESGMQDLDRGDQDSAGVLQVRQNIRPVRSVEDQVRMFLTEGATGYKGSAGAIKLSESGEPITTWLSNMWWGIGSTNYPGLEFKEQAQRWVEAWRGGTGPISSSATVTEPYAYERKKGESTWACAQRLAAEVGWRFFVVSGRVFYISEEDLYSQQVRIAIQAPTADQDGTDGIVDVDFDYDMGKPTTEATITAQARTWAAPPGTVVTLIDYGPASLGTGAPLPDIDDGPSIGIEGNVNVATGEGRGRYIVSEISGSFFTTDVTATIRKPMRELPEPAAQTRTVSTGTDPEAPTVDGDMPDAVRKMIDEAKRMNKLHQPYRWGGGHGATTSANGPWDCSGAVSRVLDAGGVLPGGQPVRSDMFADLPGFDSGKGEWVTVYGNSIHVIMEIAGHLFGTGDGTGANWLTESGSDPAAYSSQPFVASHPHGL